MASLDEATAKLHNAIQQLERAVDAQGRSGPDAEESAQLLAQLSAARQENENLQQVASMVSGRLDDVLSRLKNALDS